MTNFRLINFIKTAVFSSFLVITICCCNKNKSKDNGSTPKLRPIEKLYGNWICSSFLDSISERKSMKNILGPLTLPFAYEIQFDESFNDSVLIYNGFEQYFLPVVLKNDSVILIDDVQGEPLVLLYDSVSSTLKVMINRNNNYPIPSVYYKADEKYIQHNGRFKEAFTAVFNKATVEGQYKVISEGPLYNNEISFNKNGILNGYQGGYRYECCIGGDCLGMTVEPMNTLRIIMRDQLDEYWAWQISNNANTLSLTKIEPSNPHEPGTFHPTVPTLMLLRVK